MSWYIVQFFVIFSYNGQHFGYIFYYHVFLLRGSGRVHLRDHIEEGEMSGTCGMHGGEDTCVEGFGWEA